MAHNDVMRPCLSVNAVAHVANGISFIVYTPGSTVHRCPFDRCEQVALICPRTLVSFLSVELIARDMSGHLLVVRLTAPQALNAFALLRVCAGSK